MVNSSFEELSTFLFYHDNIVNLYHQIQQHKGVLYSHWASRWFAEGIHFMIINTKTAS